MGSERTHGKRKVAQLKLQLLLSVDSKSINVDLFNIWPNVCVSFKVLCTVRTSIEGAIL